MASQSDIKTLAVMDASELQEGQHKNVDFDGSKILVSKLQGQVYATSAYCTHYGAPLEKGVLSHDGRVVCPWHGACFNLKTGDIEDSPGLDSLWKFKAEEKDGKIMVSASEKEVKSKVGKVVAATKFAQKKAAQSGKEETVVIVGGGSGGLHAIESLRMNEFMGKIVVLSEEKYAPIDRTKLSKALVDDAEKLQFRTPEVLKNDFGVDFHSGTAVTGVNTKEQKVTTSSGEFSYDHLILAPGAKPKKIPIEGKDLENVVTLRHISDAASINKMITKDSEVVIIGTSFIGMEVAMAVLKKEPKSVNMVGVDEIPFEAILGKEIGTAIMETMKKAGVKFHMQAEIKKLNPTSEGGSAVGSLSMKDKEDLPANLVIMGTGVAPATEFLKESFSLEKDGGIKVDEYLRVEGQKNVYAIGDIAHYPQAPEGQQRRVEHWNVAGQHGREAAHNIAKPNDLVKYDKIPVFWSSVGKGLRYVGTGGGFDDSYTDGSIDELKANQFATYQAKNGKITAVASMQKDPYVAKASELIRLGLMPTLDEIRGGKVSISRPVLLEGMRLTGQNILEINTITA
ncbi:uncharacterized protein MKK02DRAFT_25715 [Dioszegia hungarica]|uniref:Rieske domain-containing protein n=1 Tax=Dioszegia hungarica TaxID=4972 RepID=A0AA38H7C6_9TREE|nr:uncharacterized protein MKK02DRAFT_25715 [Dioszegia hungarica]KAI9635272.1 hypothetical protein MKK02DRAFT_25715 [Dioszegia hungarica]